MKKAYSSKLLLSKDDFAVIYDYKYKFFLPSLILLVAIFTALSPLFKGMDFWPVFVVICVLAVIFTLFYKSINKQIKIKADNLFKDNELLEIKAEFLKEEIKVFINNQERIFKYSRISKIEKYESFYLIYTNIKDLAVFPVSKEIGELRDNSDFLDFLINTAKPKCKTVKNINLRKQKAFVCIIVLLVFALATLLPILFLITYNLFNYNHII